MLLTVTVADSHQDLQRVIFDLISHRRCFSPFDQDGASQNPQHICDLKLVEDKHLTSARERIIHRERWLEKRQG